MLQLIDVSKHFRGAHGEVRALSGINLSIRPGEIFGVIGKSGAGKSTLVRCMNLLEIPTGGEVRFDGTDLTRLSQSALRRERSKIGMIFQQFHLLEQRTVLENVCFPLEIAGGGRWDGLKKATELLTLVGLGDQLHAYPSQLSGGQKQRVAIARALVRDPLMLLCDEATSALDPSTRNAILTLLQQINQKLGVTVVIITHEMRVVRAICERVAVLEQGSLAEMGRTEEIFAAPQSQAARALLEEAEVSLACVESRATQTLSAGKACLVPHTQSVNDLHGKEYHANRIAWPIGRRSG